MWPSKTLHLYSQPDGCEGENSPQNDRLGQTSRLLCVLSETGSCCGRSESPPSKRSVLISNWRLRSS